MPSGSEVFIVGACRTAIGELGGGLAPLTAVELGAHVIREVVSRAGIEPAEVEEVMLGNVISAGVGLCPARQAAVAAGVPIESPALDVGMVCASGLRAVALGAQAIERGERQLMVVGGAESMSNAPHLVRGVRSGRKMGALEMEDALLADGLNCSIGHEHMGLTAERIAAEYGIGREEQDGFALRSHERAVAARDDFAREIAPIPVPRRKGEPVELCVDERPRPDTSIEKLAALKPAFKDGGTVTAGNSSGVNDGAAAMMLASAGAARERGLTPMARVVDWASAGVDPGRMGIGPVPATRNLCEKLGVKPTDFDLVELNEAFAAQALAVIRDLGLDPEVVNVRGGAVALGHPLGCTGARILVTLIHAMRDRGAKTGLATLCIGTGMGMALAVEAV